jgi:hypothetical protein
MFLSLFELTDLLKLNLYITYSERCRNNRIDIEKSPR